MATHSHASPPRNTAQHLSARGSHDLGPNGVPPTKPEQDDLHLQLHDGDLATPVGPDTMNNRIRRAAGRK